jgi:hypothetical protein
VTTARRRQLLGRGGLLPRAVLLVFALALIGIVADRAITSLTPRSGSRGTVTGMLEASGGPANARPRPLRGTITATAANRGILTLSVGISGRFTIHPLVGTYTFTATSPQYESGKGTCRAPGPVTVLEGSKTTTTIECQNVSATRLKVGQPSRASLERRGSLVGNWIVVFGSRTRAVAIRSVRALPWATPDSRSSSYGA